MNVAEIAEIVALGIRRYSEMHPRPSQVTQEQAAEMLGVSRATISRMIKAGILRLNRGGRIPTSEIDKALLVL